MSNVTYRAGQQPGQSQLILSLYSGIGLLDSGFETQGFCVVRGPEKITGGDIRNFRAMPGRFDGVVGGSPCQDFSRARRTPPTGEGLELLGHFCRIVQESDCSWFLLENVPGVPDVEIEGYHIQRFDLSPTMIGHKQNRLRHFQFGSKRGYVLSIRRSSFTGEAEACLTTRDRTGNRGFPEYCQLQGLPADFDLPEFTKAGKYKAVGNGVHIAVSHEVARAIAEVVSSQEPATIFNTRACGCGCGRILSGNQQSATAACRKRLQKKRHAVNAPGATARAVSHCEQPASVTTRSVTAHVASHREHAAAPEANSFTGVNQLSIF